jgi:hypothetical protein
VARRILAQAAPAREVEAAARAARIFRVRAEVFSRVNSSVGLGQVPASSTSASASPTSGALQFGKFGTGQTEAQRFGFGQGLRD